MKAVRKVTQENRGKKTAGVDGKAKLNNREREELCLNLYIDGQAERIRRIYIPKKDVKPQKESITKHMASLKAVIKSHVKAELMIAQLNPKILG